jgi:phosphatidate cytidylyltransferase
MAVSRKVLIRVVGAPILLALLGLILAWGLHLETTGRRNAPLAILLLLVGGVTLGELGAMGRARGIDVADRAASAAWGLLVLVWMDWIPGADLVPRGGAWPLVASGLGLYLLLSLVVRFGRFGPDAAGMTLLAFFYVSLLGLLLHTPAPAGSGAAVWFLVYLLAAGKGSDMAAYTAGKLFGRHPMAPRVSPHKTWEGGVAGALAGTLASYGAARLPGAAPLFGALPPLSLLGLGLFVTIAAQVGDLVKSALKRWAGVKDSGRLLPEFGGMLDMVDSFLLAAPAAHLGLELLKHVHRA